jgi:phage-related protein
VKPIEFLGDALARLRDFPDDARRGAGHQLDRIQRGLEPDDWKAMASIGPGVREIRVRGSDGTFRVIYLAALPDRVVVLHAFRKTTQQTSRRDLTLAAARLQQIRRG